MTATIYGTLVDAQAYVAERFGARYDAWAALNPTEQLKTLVNAADYLNRQKWIATADTFAERNAITDADGRLVFQISSYELGVLVNEDETITDLADQGTNISRVYAGGAGVDYANPTSVRTGSATQLPPLLQACRTHRWRRRSTGSNTKAATRRMRSTRPGRASSATPCSRASIRTRASSASARTTTW
jgi:hypothetical protein